MSALAPAFATPVDDAQVVFRAVMDAMARPGIATPIAPAVSPPQPLSRGAGAIALTLLDYETPFWLDDALASHDRVTQWLRFHTGAPVTRDRGEAAFAFFADAPRAALFDGFALGTAEYPDRSTTFVIQTRSLSGVETLRLSGPGIKGERALALTPQPAGLLEQLQANRALFPRGNDFLFVTDSVVVALPRSTRVEKG